MLEREREREVVTGFRRIGSIVDCLDGKRGKFDRKIYGNTGIILHFKMIFFKITQLYPVPNNLNFGDNW